MSSTKPYLRMKAVLMMYKVFLRYPEALRPAFPKLKEKLEDPDPGTHSSPSWRGKTFSLFRAIHFKCSNVIVIISGVQSAAVNVICELARKNPKNYLSLAPIFFKLMTTSTNNWMLIKIIKLVSFFIPLIELFWRFKKWKKNHFQLNQFGKLTVIEPQLGRRLAEPIIDIITRFNIFYEVNVVCRFS